MKLLYYHLAIYTEIEIVQKEDFELCPAIGKSKTSRKNVKETLENKKNKRNTKNNNIVILTMKII